MFFSHYKNEISPKKKMKIQNFMKTFYSVYMEVSKPKWGNFILIWLGLTHLSSQASIFPSVPVRIGLMELVIFDCWLRYFSIILYKTRCHRHLLSFMTWHDKEKPSDIIMINIFLFVVIGSNIINQKSKVL